MHLLHRNSYGFQKKAGNNCQLTNFFQISETFQCRSRHLAPNARYHNVISRSSIRLEKKHLHFLLNFHRQISEISNSSNKVEKFEIFLTQAEKLYRELKSEGIKEVPVVFVYNDKKYIPTSDTRIADYPLKHTNDKRDGF